MRRKGINERSGNQSKTKKNDRFRLENFTADELNFCVRNGNRWILVAIITGMAPLVGLEAEGDFEKGLKMSLLCAKTA